MIVKWRWNLDNGDLCLCFSTYLSKAFDCIVENKASNVFDWFSNNYLKGDPDKSNLLVKFKEKTESWITQRSVSEKLLSVTTINSILLSMFKNYVKKQVKNSMLCTNF